MGAGHRRLQLGSFRDRAGPYDREQGRAQLRQIRPPRAQAHRHAEMGRLRHRRELERGEDPRLNSCVNNLQP